jgi:hypothetical protein
MRGDIAEWLIALRRVPRLVHGASLSAGGATSGQPCGTTSCRTALTRYGSRVTLAWTRTELLVALAALHDRGWEEIKAGTTTAKSISIVLRAGDFHGPVAKPDNFRSADSVHLKCENLRTCRTGYQGAEMHGSAEDAALIAEYEANPRRIINEATGVVAALQLWAQTGRQLRSET